MSDHATSHDSHDSHGGSHEPHEPHVLPLSVYFRTWGALLVLTALTVGASYVDFGTANILIALGIATVKATLVAAIFMHLYYDHKFHTVIFTMALVFTVVFVGFTMFDTQTRGRGDAVRADRPVDMKAPFGETQSDQKIRESFGEGAPGAEGAGHAGHATNAGGNAGGNAADAGSSLNAANAADAAQIRANAGNPADAGPTLNAADAAQAKANASDAGSVGDAGSTATPATSASAGPATSASAGKPAASAGSAPSATPASSAATPTH